MSRLPTLPLLGDSLRTDEDEADEKLFHSLNLLPIPSTAQLLVLSWLSVNHLGRCLCVSQGWRELSRLHSLWRNRSCLQGKSHINSKAAFDIVQWTFREEHLTMDQRLEAHLSRGCCKCGSALNKTGRKPTAQYLALTCPSCNFVVAKQWGQIVDAIELTAQGIYQLEMVCNFDGRRVLTNCVGQSCFKLQCVKCGELQKNRNDGTFYLR